MNVNPKPGSPVVAAEVKHGGSSWMLCCRFACGAEYSPINVRGETEGDLLSEAEAVAQYLAECLSSPAEITRAEPTRTFGAFGDHVVVLDGPSGRLWVLVEGRQEELARLVAGFIAAMPEDRLAATPTP